MAGAEATLPSLWLMQNSVALRFFYIYDVTPVDRAAGLAELAQRLEEGRLIHTVAQRLPLDRVAAAHDLVEAGTLMGNLVLDIPEDAV
jgi:NADPH2:quinone reductase